MPSYYREIAEDLGARILQGEFRAGSSLPSENLLAETYGVARGTVRRALALLRTRGAVASRQGASWVVQASRQGQDFEQLRSFAQWARNRGMTPGGQVLSSATSPATVADRRRLELDDGDPVLRVVRVRTLNDRRVMLERTTYATWMIPIIQTLSPREPSVVQTLFERFGVLTSYADNTLDAVAATGEDAQALGIRRSSPLLRLRRESYDSRQRPIEYSDDRYVSGTIAFQVHTQLSDNPMQRTLGEVGERQTVSSAAEGLSSTMPMKRLPTP
ncbi:GntR family transcriptional regulator [Leifsonia poae]|uniref:GntR family transcriptional regulator n=1 Tax=Leifsonia poae TaxID=110933 RepID=UPI001CBA9680|nr:GntR family transcriptional regulator [Leifsonia poae]